MTVSLTACHHLAAWPQAHGPQPEVALPGTSTRPDALIITLDKLDLFVLVDQEMVTTYSPLVGGLTGGLPAVCVPVRGLFQLPVRLALQVSPLHQCLPCLCWHLCHRACRHRCTESSAMQHTCRAHA